jgi:hypothetical protein
MVGCNTGRGEISLAVEQAEINIAKAIERIDLFFFSMALPHFLCYDYWYLLNISGRDQTSEVSETSEVSAAPTF